MEMDNTCLQGGEGMHRSWRYAPPPLSSLLGGARAHHRHGTTGRDRRNGGSHSRARTRGLALELVPCDLCPAQGGEGMHRSWRYVPPPLSSLLGGARAHHRHGTTGRDRRNGGSHSRARTRGLALELVPCDLCPATCGRRRAAQCVAIRVGWRPLHRLPFPLRPVCCVVALPAAGHPPP